MEHIQRIKKVKIPDWLNTYQKPLETTLEFYFTFHLV